MHTGTGRARIVAAVHPSPGTTAMPPTVTIARPPKYQVLPDLPPEEFEALKERRFDNFPTS